MVDSGSSRNSRNSWRNFAANNSDSGNFVTGMKKQNAERVLTEDGFSLARPLSRAPLVNGNNLSDVKPRVCCLTFLFSPIKPAKTQRPTKRKLHISQSSLIKTSL